MPNDPVFWANESLRVAFDQRDLDAFDEGRRNMGIEYEAPLSAADGIGCPGCGIQPPVSGTRADTCCTVRNVYAEEIKVPMTLRPNAEVSGLSTRPPG